MRMKKLLGCVVIVLCLTAATQAGLLATNGQTNNITDFNFGPEGSNVVAGGQWSYLLQTSPMTDRIPDTGTQPDGTIQWKEVSQTGDLWWVRSDGVHAYDWQLGSNYTIDTDEGGTVDISGTWTAAAGVDWAGVIVQVLAVRDGNATVVDYGASDANVEVLWQGEWGGASGWGTDPKTFSLSGVSVQPGDDIYFRGYWTNISGDGANRGWWWEAKAKLDATITPEPATLCLLSGGMIGFVLRRRK